jgi:malonyl-CoA decarboxylase
MSFFSDLLQTIADRGRAIITSNRPGMPGARPLWTLCEDLLSSKGEASGVALAREILGRYDALDTKSRQAFLIDMLDRFGAETGRLERAIAAWREEPGNRTLLELHQAAEPRRQELIRRLNLSPGGTLALVRMREELLKFQKNAPELEALDADFAHLFSSWFNRGFLVLRPIDWTTPASILEKIIRYEAVHAIESWDDLRRRLQPADRRCFAFFHPQIADEPLIFVEVALTTAIPASIGALLTEDRVELEPRLATTATFYSISNCQSGLRGISFGNFLIKQVVEELARQLPGIKTFVTLSPVPAFGQWLARQRADEASPALTHEDRAILAPLDTPEWYRDAAISEPARKAVMAAAAYFFLQGRTSSGRPLDPVARFHLGNGARLERINWLGDVSAKGLKQSNGIMVNYLYDLDHIERNHEAFANKGKVAASSAVRGLLRADLNTRDLVSLAP